ncbi:MAG: histidine kinase [Betaproteobacteria bacterium]
MRSRWQLIVAFVVLLVGIDWTRAWSFDGSPSFVEALAYQASGSLGGMTGMVLGASFPRRGWVGGLVTATAIIVAVLAALGAYAVLRLGAPRPPPSDVLSMTAFVVRGVWFYGVAALLFAAFCAMRDRRMALVRAVQAAELERASIQRQVLDSRLMVMQARIEPAFLFSTLETVRMLYGRAPETAERMLDELILYLRAALPQMRGETSTLAREAELARAYLGVLNVPLAAPVTLDISIEGGAGDTPFPPMVLLPLLQAAASAGLESRNAVRIRGWIDVAGLCVLITVDGGARPENWRHEAMVGPREALAATCGRACDIRCESCGETHQVLISIAEDLLASVALRS